MSSEMLSAFAPKIPATLSVADLSKYFPVFGRTPAAVRKRRERAPATLPEPLQIEGRQLFWLASDVVGWLEARRVTPPETPSENPAALHPANPSTKRGRGRPRKSVGQGVE